MQMQSGALDAGSGETGLWGCLKPFNDDIVAVDLGFGILGVGGGGQAWGGGATTATSGLRCRLLMHLVHLRRLGWSMQMRSGALDAGPGVHVIVCFWLSRSLGLYGPGKQEDFGGVVDLLNFLILEALLTTHPPSAHIDMRFPHLTPPPSLALSAVSPWSLKLMPPPLPSPPAAVPIPPPPTHTGTLFWPWEAASPLQRCSDCSGAATHPPRPC
jgi:hypothetical protein